MNDDIARVIPEDDAVPPQEEQIVEEDEDEEEAPASVVSPEGMRSFGRDYLGIPEEEFDEDEEADRE